MEDNNEFSYEINLSEIFSLLKRKIWYIIASVVGCAAIAFLISCFLIAPKYESSVNMIVNTRQENSTNMTNDNITSARNLVPTYAIILKSNTVLNQVAESLGLSYSYNELNNMIKVESLNNTQVMRVSCVSADAAEAQKIIKSIAEIAPQKIVDAVEAGSCKVISDVTYSHVPVSPNKHRNTILGGMIGLILSLGIIILKSLTRNYITDDTDIQKLLNLPVIGVIPYIDVDKAGRRE